MSTEPAPGSQVEDPFALPAYTPCTDERLFALLMHLVPAILFATGRLPAVVPTVVRAVRGDQSRWVRAHAYEALNFQLTIIVFSVIGAVLSTVGVGVCLLMGMAAFAVIIGVVAGVKAYGSSAWRSPFCIRFLKV
jgi:hypothetical protein